MGYAYARLFTAVKENPRPWRWANVLITAATVMNILAFSLLTAILRSVGNYLLGESAQIIFLVGAVLLIAVKAFRVGVESIAGEIMDKEGPDAIPGWFEAIQGWGTHLTFIYLVLGYSATAIAGVALLKAAILPGWLGRLSVVFGIAGVLSLIFTIPRYQDYEFSVAFIPLWRHIVPIFLGIALIVQT